MPITLVRHTTPDVADGLCYGQSDVPLRASFAQEAAVVLEQLRACQQIDQVVSSPLSRTLKLAELIAEVFAAPLRLESGLLELNFGHWEGRLWQQIPAAETKAWFADILNATPHGGESVCILRDRVHRALSACQAEPQHVVCVTHAGVIKAALAGADLTASGSKIWGKEVNYGAVLSWPANG